MSEQILFLKPNDKVTFSSTGQSEVTFEPPTNIHLKSSEMDSKPKTLLALINELGPDDELADSIKEAMTETRKLKIKSSEF